jgi:hypothetical protein
MKASFYEAEGLCAQADSFLWDVIRQCAPCFLWAYNCPMKIVNFPPQHQQVGANGECPHCSVFSYFRPTASCFEHRPNGLQFVISAAQCESCKEFVMVIGERNLNQGGQPPCFLRSVYPLGKPNDTVPPEVVQEAKEVAEDFKEALRCHWIKSYRASVVMCRRAIQSSAIALKAAGGRLIDQIDDLFKTGKITEGLKDFAHEIRLTGNDGAHPDKDGLADVKEGDSSAIIEFTREYLHHVYVMPAKLKARKAVSAAPHKP